MRPRVLITRRLPSTVMSDLEAHADVVTLDGPVTHAGLVESILDVDALIPMVTDPVNRAVIERARRLRVIANVGVGYNNIDVQAAREHGVVVTNTPDVLTRATADLTWALILSITRRLGEGERLVRRGEWSGWAFDQLLGMELQEKTLGVVGYGRIGREVAARAPAFGMHVVHTGHDRDAIPLDRLLSTADVVSLHVPLLPETTHLIDQPAFARMKRSGYLINTARGPVVDEAALVWALKSRLIAGAALDVYENEPQVTPELLAFENVLLVPHLGSATRETRTAMAQLAARNVLAIFSGEPPLTEVR